MLLSQLRTYSFPRILLTLCLLAPVVGFSTTSIAAPATPVTPAPVNLAAATQVTEQTININTGSAATISASLKGIGLKKAQAIIEWREANGAFTSVEQLTEVKGIGEKTLMANRDKITL